MTLVDAYNKAQSLTLTFYYRGLYEIGKKRGIRSAAGVVDGKRMEAVLRTPWSGKNYSERIWHNNAKLGETIQRNIVAAAHRGVPVSDMVRDVRERMGVDTSDATRLVRTELNYVQNQAALDSIKDAGMTYYRFIATLDNRTTPLCRSKDGEVFPVDDAEAGTNMPPLHPRCRSIISGSLYAEHNPRKGTRIARDERGKNVFVPAGMRYGEWKRVYIDKKQTVVEWKNFVEHATMKARGEPSVLRAKKRNHKIMITDIAIDKVSCIKMPDISLCECERIQAAHKRLLRIAQTLNDSDEVLAILSFANVDEIHVLGNETEVKPAKDMKARMAFLTSGYRELMYLHNHPSTSTFSMADIDTFITQACIGLMSVVTNQGEVYILHKNHRYTYQQVRELLFSIKEIANEDIEKTIDLFLRNCGKVGIDYGKAK